MEPIRSDPGWWKRLDDADRGSAVALLDVLHHVETPSPLADREAVAAVVRLSELHTALVAREHPPATTPKVPPPPEASPPADPAPPDQPPAPSPDLGPDQPPAPQPDRRDIIVDIGNPFGPKNPFW
jgi:hypothetical protein